MEFSMEQAQANAKAMIRALRAFEYTEKVLTTAIQAEQSIAMIEARLKELHGLLSVGETDYAKAKAHWAKNVAQAKTDFERTQARLATEMATGRAGWAVEQANRVETENQARASTAVKVDKLARMVAEKQGELAVAQGDLAAVKEKLDALRESVKGVG